MKKILFLLLISITAYGQARFPEGIKLGGNGPTVSTSKLISQDVNGNLNYIDAANLPLSTGVNSALILKENANQHKYLLGNFYKKIYAQKTGVDQIKWLTFGDSYAQLIFKEIGAKIEKIGGNNVAGAYFNGSYKGVTNNSSTGAITENTTDYQSWVTGLTTSFTAGASRTYGFSGSKVNATKIKVYYVLEPGAGTFKIQVNGVDAAGYTNVSAVGTLGNLGIATITQARTLSDWSIVNLTGTIKIIGVGFEDSTVSGQTVINVSQGGIPLGGSLNSVTGYVTAMSNFNSFLADVQPTIFSFEMKESSSYYATALNTFYTAINSNLINTDVINIGSSPVSSGDADQVICNTQLETVSTSFGYKYYDTYKIFGSYAPISALGWGGDGIHLTPEAHQYRGKLLLNDFAFYPEAEVMPNNVVNDRIDTKFINSNVNTGTGTAATFQAAGTVDVTIQSNNLSGGSANLNLFSGFSAVNGNSFIRATSAELRLFASSVGGPASKVTLWTGNAERASLSSTGVWTWNTQPATSAGAYKILTINGSGVVESVLSNTYQTALTNPITGTGVNGRVSFWNGTNTQGSTANLLWDDTNSRLAVGSVGVAPETKLDVQNGTGVDALTSYFTKGPHDGLFRLGFANGSGNSLNSEQASLRFDYNLTPIAKIGFHRSGVSTSNAITFNLGTAGISEAARFTGSKELLIGTSTSNAVDKLQIVGTASGTVDATLSNQFVRKGQLDVVQAAARPYKVYTALVTQSGTSAPTVKILENNTGLTITPSYSSTGTYWFTYSVATAPDKVYGVISDNNNYSGSATVSKGLSFSTDKFIITTQIGSTLTNSLLLDAPIEIRIYP